MIEVVTVNGFRKLLGVNYIISINELRNNGKSNTCISMSNNDVIFVDDTYDAVMKQYMNVQAMKNKLGGTDNA